jgi:hypothetical protein
LRRLGRRHRRHDDARATIEELRDRQPAIAILLEQAEDDRTHGPELVDARVHWQWIFVQDRAHDRLRIGTCERRASGDHLV